MRPEYFNALWLGVAAIGFMAACLGIFKAGWSAGTFFTSFGKIAGLMSATMQRHMQQQDELIRLAERQAVAQERSADLVPLLERMEASYQQLGTELRVISREMRQLKDRIPGATDGSEN